MNVKLVFGLVLVAGTALQWSGAEVAEFDANNVTKMEFTFRGVPGRDGMAGQPGPVGPQGTVCVLWSHYSRQKINVRNNN